MSAYDYGNARVRAMRSRLLTAANYELLLGTASVAGMISELVETPYRDAVEQALAGSSGIESLNQAWRLALVQSVGKLPGFYESDAAARVSLALGRYDVVNLKTVLRGLSQQLPPNEILNLTLPIGSLSRPELRRLSRASDPRAAIDLLATWASPLVQPLLRLRAEQPGSEVFFLELALEKWYWQQVLQVPDEETVWHEAMALEIDSINILTALRLAGRPEVRTLLQTMRGTRAEGEVAELAALFVGPAQLNIETLVDMTTQPSRAAAIGLLQTTTRGNSLLNGGSVPEQLSSIERHLEAYKLAHAQRLFGRDPLGVGVPLAYIILKTNEITNLRLIAQGLLLQEPPAAVRKRLLVTK